MRSRGGRERGRPWLAVVPFGRGEDPWVRSVVTALGARTVVLAPYAACEQHSRHLPFYTDTILCTAVAEGLDVAQDGRAYTFVLDRRARWSDGAPVTAGDFVFSLERMRADGAPIVHLLDDPELAKRVAAGQQRLVRDHFTLRVVTDAHIAMYERALAPSRPSV